MQGNLCRRNFKLSSYLMAWRSHGQNNNDLVTQLYENDVISSEIIADVMKATDRKFYCKYSLYFILDTEEHKEKKNPSF
jgi:hypothetical protein